MTSRRRPPVGSVAPIRRLAAIAALVAGAASVAWLVVFGIRNLPALLLALASAAAIIAGAWRAFLGRGSARGLGLSLSGVGVCGIVASALATTDDTTDLVARIVVFLGLIGLALGAGRFALDLEIDRARVHPAWRHIGRAAHPTLIINPRSGEGRAEEVGLEAAARAKGIEVVVLAPDDDLVALAHDAVDRGADALGMAGGDGSLALVAAVAHERGVAFVCVPSGTRNHLALDLALDRSDPLAALAAFGSAAERRIDYASVNGRLFLNNVSLGAYGEMVQDPRYRDDKTGTALQLLSELTSDERDPYDLRFQGPEGEEVAGAYLIQVSNNRYLLDRLLDFGLRPRLDGGELGIVALRGDRQVDLTALLALTAARQLTRSAAVLEWGTDEFVVEAGDRKVWAGVDGEAVELRSPLQFRIHPLGLRVRVPAENPGAAEQRRRREARVRNLARLASGREPHA